MEESSARIYVTVALHAGYSLNHSTCILTAAISYANQCVKKHNVVTFKKYKVRDKK